jgi:DNA-binding transcriptional regulator LsrR (DeoR family)/DNA-binding XRE family transcriptional regulator
MASPPAEAEYLKPFGTRLQQLRRKKGLTQAEAAANVLGVGVSTYAAWERGEFAPRIEQFLRLADWHQVSLDYLLGRASGDLPAASAHGVTWRLARSQPSRELKDGADVWERLVKGEDYATIAGTLDLGDQDPEDLVQELVISGSLLVKDITRNKELEQQVRQRFTGDKGARLRHVSVADLDHIKSPFVRYVLLGYLAKDLFKQVVRAGTKVGLSGGFAVSRMVHALQRGDCPGGVQVFPVAVTPVFEKAAVSANGVVSALAYRHFTFNVQGTELPFVFDEVRDAFQDEDTSRLSPPLRIAKRALDGAAEVDVVFMGIGGRTSGALAQDILDLQRDYQWLADVDVEVIRRQSRPAGDILYHLVDAEGHPLPDFTDQNEGLVWSIGLDGLRKIVNRGKRVVVIASGREKADVTRAAISAGCANVLIVDDGLARGLL